MKFYAPTKLSDNMRKTPEGFLVCIGVPIARLGKLEYMRGEIPVEADDNGKIIIERSEDEVFNPKSMASYEGKAFTIRHPEDEVDPQNWNRLSKGHLANLRRGEGEEKDCLLADVFITDNATIKIVEEGKMREVSCGYEALYVEVKPGYGLQKDIVGNHLALVEEGRAGDRIAIKDHKGEDNTMTEDQKAQASMREKLKGAWTKFFDTAFKDEDISNGNPTTPPKEGSGKDESNMAMSKDEMKSMVKDALSEMFGKKEESKDEDLKDKKEEKKPAESKDEETGKSEPITAKDEDDSNIESRLNALEQLVKKLCGDTGDEDEEEMTGDEDEEEMTGDEDEGDEESDSASSMTGDEKARAEILAPGIKAGKNLKDRALKAAYQTKDGKAVLDSLLGGKKLTLDHAATVDTMFFASSELLKAKRSGSLKSTKQFRDSKDEAQKTLSTTSGVTPEQLNKMNEERYNKNK